MYIDENGDAAGNYTILALKSMESNLSTTNGLHPIGTFSPPNGNQIPVSSHIASVSLWSVMGVNYYWLFSRTHAYMFSLFI